MLGSQVRVAIEKLYEGFLRHFLRYPAGRSWSQFPANLPNAVKSVLHQQLARRRSTIIPRSHSQDGHSDGSATTRPTLVCLFKISSNSDAMPSNKNKDHKTDDDKNIARRRSHKFSVTMGYLGSKFDWQIFVYFF